MRPICKSDGCKNPVKYNGYTTTGNRKYYKYCSYCLKKKYNGVTPSQYKSEDRLKQYNLTKQQYNAMLNRQQNCCAICGCNFTKTPNIDHCHDTGAVRGLLCYKCNAGLGLLGDSKETIEKALRYLS